jgi:hypothetical protein
MKVDGEKKVGIVLEKEGTISPSRRGMGTCFDNKLPRVKSAFSVLHEWP